ncbi:MAG: hypothetical protein ACI96M_001854 [Candidatus Azotimanducaceae bacterium]|jgi:hypothetical protein
MLPVILLTMLVLNPVQVYVEFLDKDYIVPGYLDFWLVSYLPGDPYPNRMLPTWDHLWFELPNRSRSAHLPAPPTHLTCGSVPTFSHGLTLRNRGRPAHFSYGTRFVSNL